MVVIQGDIRSLDCSSYASLGRAARNVRLRCFESKLFLVGLYRE